MQVVELLMDAGMAKRAVIDAIGRNLKRCGRLLRKDKKKFVLKHERGVKHHGSYTIE